VEQNKGKLPVPEIHLKRNASVCNLRTRLSKVRGYLAKSTAPHLRSEWESRITKYESQLAKAVAHARDFGAR
jgi:hypothetical protein